MCLGLSVSRFRRWTKECLNINSVHSHDPHGRRYREKLVVLKQPLTDTSSTLNEEEEKEEGLYRQRRFGVSLN